MHSGLSPSTDTRYSTGSNLLKLMKLIRFLAVLLTAIAITPSPLRAAPEPLRNDLGTYTRKVTTKNPQAQKYFNQGLALVHGFNHSAAIRSFQEAANLDPDCAMTHW